MITGMPLPPSSVREKDHIFSTLDPPTSTSTSKSLTLQNRSCNLMDNVLLIMHPLSILKDTQFNSR